MFQDWKLWHLVIVTRFFQPLVFNQGGSAESSKEISQNTYFWVLPESYWMGPRACAFWKKLPGWGQVLHIHPSQWLGILFSSLRHFHRHLSKFPCAALFFYLHNRLKWGNPGVPGRGGGGGLSLITQGTYSDKRLWDAAISSCKAQAEILACLIAQVFTF